MRTLLRAPIFIAATLLAACAAPAQRSPVGGRPLPGLPAPAQRPTVLLISFDGFRPDYLDRGVTPNLNRLASEGVRARALIPSFPTKTFPNHYTIVTGLYPEHHGIVANNMYDPDLDARFSLADRGAVGDGRWWGGEPIWVAVTRAGGVSATLYWPGSEAKIRGYRPTYWHPYDATVPNDARVATFLRWLELPAARRPQFIAGYFSDTDDAGHRFGPNSPHILDAVRELDRVTGELVRGLDERGLASRVDLIILSDHGMAELSPQRVIFLDNYLDPASVDVVDWDPVLSMWPASEDVDRVYRSLAGAHPHLHVYRRGQIPARLHYRANRRIAPIVGIVDPGWTLTTHARFERTRDHFLLGNHGFDNQAPSMRALFIARGPSFRRGSVVDGFSNVDIYPLIMRILGLPPEASDGDPHTADLLLRPSAESVAGK